EEKESKELELTGGEDKLLKDKLLNLGEDKVQASPN
ncbi:hypothetical protein Tco_1364635, partial [Tanacetum coccineum]